MHKSNLLKRMKELGACREATAWVTGHESNDAAAIWRDCDNHEWLIWFFCRVRPKLAQKFAFRCADRAVREYAPLALDAAGFKEEAAKLRAIAPIVDKETAEIAGKASASYAATAASSSSYASWAASSASSSWAASYASASYAAERTKQLADLHAWADNWKAG